MLPRWFRVVLTLEIVGIAAFVVLAVHLIGQGMHAAGDALTWLHPGHHATTVSPPPQPTSGALPQPGARRSPSHIAGVEVLTPQLFARLNRQTGAFAATEYALLLDLETLARDEMMRLLAGVHVPPASDAP
jgi:hypothetical protein